METKVSVNAEVPLTQRVSDHNDKTPRPWISRIGERMNPGRLKAWGWRYAERHPFVYAAGATIAFVFPPVVLYEAMGLNSIEIAGSSDFSGGRWS